MQEFGHGHPRILAIGMVLSVALGVLLMHGLDAHATAAGHGLTAAPSALIADISAAATWGDEPVAPGSQHGHSMAGLCLAVLAAGLMLLAGTFSISRVLSARAHRDCSVWVDAMAAPWSRRAPPSAPRSALCVSLS